MNSKKSSRWLIVVGTIALLALTGQSCVLTSGQSTDGGIYRSDDGGRTWSRKIMIGKVKNKTVTIASVNTGIIAFHPTDRSTIYLGTRGNGLYRTEDSGERWQITGINTGTVIALALDPKTPQIIYAGNGGHIEKSSDSGQTWQRVYIETRANLTVTSIVIDRLDPSHVFASNSGGVILESRDYGTTWNIVTVLSGSIKLYGHPTDSNILFSAGDQFGLARSSDQGKTWTILTETLKSFPGALKINDLAIARSLPSTLLLATNNGLLKSADLGSTWTQMKTLVPNQTVTIKTVTIAPENTELIYFTAQNNIHLTNDGGETWEVARLPTNRDINYLIINPINPAQLFVGLITIKK